MAVIDFPSSPSIGQIYTQNSLSWIWTGITWDSYSNSPTTPVHIIYNTIAELLADQANQFEGFLYYVTENETYYNYLGTINEDVDLDYNIVGGLGVINDNINNEVLVIYVNPDDLSGTGTIEEQICEYINDNITIDYSRQYSKLNIILGIDPNPGPSELEIINGILYNWYALVDERNIASEGWRAPSVEDFYTLEAFIDPLYENIGGAKLKETGTVYWDDPNVGATNETGFNSRGAGQRTTDFVEIKYRHTIWSITPIFDDSLIFCGQTRNDAPSFITYYSAPREHGQSIRLIKETTELSHGESGEYIGNDGKIYRTICINGQEWLADNLAETKYRNGDDIPEVTDQTTWEGLTTGARCFYDNNESNAYVI